MDAVEYERTREFAIAMARGGWEHMTEARREKLAAKVEYFFDVYLPSDHEALPRIRAWDQTDRDPEADGWARETYVCDLVSEFMERWTPERVWERNGDGKFASCIAACIRAGMDVAAEQSAGVVGFTVGDVRRMYGGVIPDWVNEAYEGQLAAAADDAQVWL